MDRSEAEVICGMLVAAFPRDRMPESTMLAWSSGLEDVEYQDARLAVGELMLDEDRMPSLHRLLIASQEQKRKRYPQLREGAPESVYFDDWLAENPQYREILDAIGRHVDELKLGADG